MSRRASDKTQARLMHILLALAVVSSVLAAVIGYKAIRAIDGFNEFVQAASEVRRTRSLVPEGY